MPQDISIPSRVRKLSNSIRNALTPSSSSTTPGRKLTRRISVDDIGKPQPLIAYSADAWLPTKEERDASKPRRPHRPSVDERPPVVRDPRDRELEQRMVRDANTLRRPERPREADLPYGVKGSVPIHDVPASLAQPPRASGSTRSRASQGGSVPFPLSTRDIGAPKALPPREPPRKAQMGESSAQDWSPPGPSRAPIFSPFMPVRRSPSMASTKTMPEPRHAEGARPSKKRDGKPISVNEYLDGLSAREAKGKERATEGGRRGSWCDYEPEEPATVRRQGAIRRPSRASDAALPPSQLRDRFGRSEDTLVAPPHQPAGLQRSHSTATRGTLRPKHAPPSPSPLKPKPMEPRDVPRDIGPRFTQDSLLHWDAGSAKSTDSEQMVIPPAPVATKRLVEKAQASMPLRYPPVPRDVQLSAPDPQRASSFKAEVGHVGAAPRPEPQPRNRAEPVEERRREHPGRKHAQTVEYYPLTQFYNEVALANALTQEGVPPLPALPPSAGTSTGGARPEPLRVQKRDSGERDAEVKTKRR